MAALQMASRPSSSGNRAASAHVGKGQEMFEKRRREMLAHDGVEESPTEKEREKKTRSPTSGNDMFEKRRLARLEAEAAQHAEDQANGDVRESSKSKGRKSIERASITKRGPFNHQRSQSAAPPGTLNKPRTNTQKGVDLFEKRKLQIAAQEAADAEAARHMGRQPTNPSGSREPSPTLPVRTGELHRGSQTQRSVSPTSPGGVRSSLRKSTTRLEEKRPSRLRTVKLGDASPTGNPPTPRSPSAFVDAHVAKVNDNVVLIDNILEYQVQNKGFRLLDERWPVEGMDVLPRAKNGSMLLLREKMVKDLLMQRVSLKDLPGSDVAAVQGDLRRLSMRQLCRLRAIYLELRSHVAAVQGFIEMTESLLLEHLAKEALHPIWVELTEKPTNMELKAIAQTFVLIVATSTEIVNVVKTPWWVCWLKQQRIYFNVDKFECQAFFPELGALELEDQTRRDHGSANRTQFRWQTNFVGAESELGLRKAANAVRSGGRMITVSPTALSNPKDLANALSGLKKVRAVTEPAGDDDASP